jgi:NodT family efflux transporter outer membrane factor (OMF) lipoprotein
MKRLWAALLAAPLLSGCLTAPETTPQVKEIAPAALGLGAQAAPQPASDWWKAFGDPQADRLAARLMADNPTLAAALARIRGAQADLSAARADSYPQVSLDGSAQRRLLSDAYVIPKPYAGNWVWDSNIAANLNWSLDFWGRQSALIDKARGTAEAAALDAEAARMALAGSFAQAYVGLILAWQNIDIAQQTVKERQTILDLTRSRVDAGLENEAALEQARSLLAMARIDVMAFSAQRDRLIHAVAALTGQGAAAYAGIRRPTAKLDAVLPLPAALPADLLARRPDILAARARITAATRGRDAAHADFYPNINLAATLGLQSVGLSSLFGGDALTLGAGPAIHLPVFDAGRIRAQYADATAELDLAVADYNQAVLAAIRQSADALTDVRSLEHQRGQQQTALDSADHAFRLAEERYRLGLSGQIPMLTAEATLLDARRQMAALRARTAIGRVTLLLSVGGGMQLPETRTATNSPTPTAQASAKP